jgi:hypothetical protein
MALPQLTVNVNSLRDPGGNPVRLHGLCPEFINDVGSKYGYASMMQRMVDQKARIVRIFIRPDIFDGDRTGYINNYIKPAVTEATNRNLYVILDYHRIDNPRLVDANVQAAWRALAPVYKNQPNVMFELFNEPSATWEPHRTDPTKNDYISFSDFRTRFQNYINIIRNEIGANNIILVPGGWYSQHILKYEDDANFYTGGNIAVVYHFYPGGWDTTGTDGNANLNKPVVSELARVANKRVVFITEYGYDTVRTDAHDTSFNVPDYRDGNSSKGKMAADKLMEHLGVNSTSYVAAKASEGWRPGLYDDALNFRTDAVRFHGIMTRDLLARNYDLYQPQETTTPPPPMFIKRINCAGAAYRTANTCTEFEADTGYIGGSAAVRGSIGIEATNDPELFRTERYGVDKYQFPVPNGTYEVVLGFCETFSGVTAAGQRRFNVAVNNVVKNGIDPYALAGGRNKAVLSTFTGVVVTNGLLVIDFTPVAQSPIVNSIQIKQLS